MTLKNINSLRGIGNRAGSGGVLYFANAPFDFQGTSIEMASNTAFGISDNGRGGAFYFNGTIVSFSGNAVKFTSNSARTNGGAI
jgi:hypothetical protein